MAINVFAAATEKAAKKPKAKDLKVIVPVILGDKLTRLQEVRDQLAELEAEEAMLVGEVKPIAEEKYLELYNKNKSKPDSFVLQSDDGGKMLVIVQDAYQKMSEAKMQDIQRDYPKQVNELIDKQTVYKFNNELLTKYQKQLAAAIGKIKEIPDEEKAELIEAEEKITVRKGTIAKLFAFKNPQTLFSIIRPTVQLKNQSSDDK